MLKLTLRTAWAHKRRFAGTFLAVVIGVAFLSGTLLLGDTLDANFQRLFVQANGSTDVVVRSTTKVNDSPAGANRAAIDGALADRVGGVDGVRMVVPYIEGFGQLLGRDGKPIGGVGPPTRAANWVAEPSLNAYHVVEGRAPEADDEVVINRGAADSGDLHLGDSTTLLTPQPLTVRIVGISAFGTADGFGPSTFTGLTLAEAQRVLTHDSGQVTQILVEAEPGVAQRDLAQRVGSVLPDGVEAITGGQLAAENFQQLSSDFLGLVRNGLVAFALVALVVAAFSIFNTFSIVVAQRTRESALLRALGATRRQLVTTNAVETLGVGIVGSAAGLAAGVGLAGLLKGVFDAFGFALPAGGLVVEPSSITIALAAGVLATAVAGLVPAVRASRVAPLRALRDVAVERPVHWRGRTIAGATLALAGLGAVVAATAGGGGALAGLGALATVAGAVVLGPVLARPAVAVLGRPLATTRGVSGALARDNAGRNPRRTAATASALTVGVAIVALFTVFGASLKASAAKTVDDSLDADLVVDTPGYGGQSGRSGFTPQLAQSIRAMTGVSEVSEIGAGSTVVDGSISAVSVVDPATVLDAVALGDGGADVARLDAGSIAVSHDEAAARGWRQGTVVTIVYPDGATAPLTVAAIYGRSGFVGDYLLARSAWAPHTGQMIDRQVLVRVDSPAAVAALQHSISYLARPFGDVRVQTRDEFRASATAGVNTILGLVYVMLALAIVIALMGIGNTLSLSISERTRELGLLRAVGFTRGQTRSMVRWESVVISVFGTAVGVLLGTFLGWALVTASASSAISVVSMPVAPMVVFLVVGALAGTVAGARPARRAARVDILPAIAHE